MPGRMKATRMMSCGTLLGTDIQVSRLRCKQQQRTETTEGGERQANRRITSPSHQRNWRTLLQFEQLGDLEPVHPGGPIVGGVVAGVLRGLGDLVALDRKEQPDQLLTHEPTQHRVLL